MNPDSRVSLQTLASELGLAKSTVSMALKNHPDVAEATRLRVSQTAEKLGYRRDADLATVMAHIQNRKPRAYQANLALIPFSTTKVSLLEIQGCCARAKELGFKVDVLDGFSTLHHPLRLLESRGIQGVIFIGWPLRDFPSDDGNLRMVCGRYPCAVSASKPVDPPINSVISDAFMTMRIAMQELCGLGYKRPAAVINPYLDNAQDQPYTGAFLAAQQELPPARRIAPAYWIEQPGKVLPWLRKVKPDCILTHDNFLLIQLRSQGFRIPEDLGFVHLDLDQERLAKGITGIQQNHAAIGGAAVDMVVAQIRRAEFGIPEIQKCTVIEPRWREGTTTRSL